MQRSERWDAAKSGLSTYNTGKPCSKGHISDRYTASGGCVECIKGYAKSYNRKISAKLRDNAVKLDNLDVKTESVFIIIHQKDMATIKAILDIFVLTNCPEFHPDSVNQYPFKKVKYFGDGSVARVQVRMPHGKFEEINTIANNLRMLSSEPIKPPNFSALPVTHKNEIPDDLENI